jgi:hypothetical protein
MRVQVRALSTLAAVSVLTAVPVAQTMPLSKHNGLQRYFAATSAQITSYRALASRLDSILSEQPMVNVDPKVEKLYKIADRFEDLAARWHRIAATNGLRTRHTGMGRVFEIEARGWRIYAAALFTRHLDELHAATTQLGSMLRSAAYLQRRWAAALRGALIRADLSVPRWLHRMATSPL